MMSSLIPVRFSSFRVTTTSPMTFAICTVPGSWFQVPGSGFVELDGVDHADDGGVDGAILHPRRHARRAAADDEDGVAHAGVDRVDGDEVAAFRLATRIHRPREQQLVA